MQINEKYVATLEGNLPFLKDVLREILRIEGIEPGFLKRVTV